MERDPRHCEIITKIEAAERQLCGAIRMFFDEGDMIAVHTLATAAQQILLDLALPLGIYSFFNDEKLTDLRDVFRTSQNFLKHADRDSDGKLPFFPEITKFHLLDACFLVCTLTHRVLPEVTGFLGWFLTQFPHLFDSPHFAATIEMAKGLKGFSEFDAVLTEIDRLAIRDLFATNDN